MYKSLIRPLLFSLNPEFAHRMAMSLLAIVGKWSAFRALTNRLYRCTGSQLERRMLGCHFKNPVGLAAGFDKNGQLIDELAHFGFGFIEIGTVTPRPQPGNPTPRLFRLPKDQALINRLGFNNIGAQAVADLLSKRQQSQRLHDNTIVGINIGKNKNTPNAEAKKDYEICFRILCPYADYFVINVSSPNTPGLRALHNKENLHDLLTHIKGLSTASEHPKPILLKIAPDLSTPQLDDVVHIVKTIPIDGIVATNTTISRNSLTTSEERIKAIGEGGLSGRPLTGQATDTIEYLRQSLGEGFPIIGVGGIMSPKDAIDKIKAGADLVQLYTGFVYEGPMLVKQINTILARNLY